MRKSLAIPERMRCRSVFVLVAFPPPPVYVLDNEAQPKLSGVRYPEADHFLCGRRRVFIRAARTNLPTHPAQAFRLRRERQWQQLNRRLLSSSIASPQCLPISSPVTAAVTTATGGGLYAGASGVSRLFFENFFRPFSADFSPFRAIQKLHPQPISTGGNFMRAPVENRAHAILPRRDEKSFAPLLDLRTSVPPCGPGVGCVRRVASTHARAARVS